MGSFFSYTLSSGIFLLVLYLIYKVLFSGHNSPVFNRGVLASVYILSLSVPLLAVVIPAITSVSGGLTPHPGLQFGQLEAVGMQDDGSFPWQRVVLWGYLAGAVAVLVFSGTVIARLVRMVSRGRRIGMEGFTLVVVNDPAVVPFSWYRYIVINRDDYSGPYASMIITHELRHLRSCHWIDLLVAQAVAVVCWYNPAAWLMMAEFKDVHEFEADRKVIDSGVDIYQYQMLLIKKAVGARFPSLANSLNHSKLKKRITMMSYQKKSRAGFVRLLVMAPAIVGAVVLTGLPAVADAVGSFGNVTLADPGNEAFAESRLSVDIRKGSEKASLVQEARAEAAPQNAAPSQKAGETLASFPGGEMKMFKFLMDNIKYPEAAANDSIQGKVAVGFQVGADGKLSDIKVVKSVSPALDEEAVRVVRLMPDFIPARKDGVAVESSYVIPISFRLQ